MSNKEKGRRFSSWLHFLTLYLLVSGAFVQATKAVAQTAGPAYPTLAALKAATAGVAPLVYRYGYNVAGDADLLPYRWSSSACSLNSGAGDNGSQVKPNAGTGCWLAVFPATGINPKQFGVVGDGATDDTTDWQNTINYTESVAGKIVVPTGVISYIKNGGLIATKPVIIEGAGVSPGVVQTGYDCAGGPGFTTRSNMSLPTLNGTGSQVSGLCFSMGISGSPATSGAAITIGSNGSPGAVNLTAARNVIYYAYIGIDVGGVSSNTIPGTNTVLVRDNMILYPAHIGIAVGRLSSDNTTIGVSIVNNNVSCAGTTLADYGVAVYDAYIADFHGNEPTACKVGTGIIPGTAANGHGQVAIGNFSDILGDSSTVNNLLVNAATSVAKVEYLDFTRWWAGMVADEQGSGILLENTGNGIVSTISFTGGMIHGGNNGALNLIDLEDAVKNVTITGNMIGADGGGNSNVGIFDNSSGQNLSIIGNNFEGLPGQGLLATGVNIASTAGDLLTISGNDFGDIGNMITFGPTLTTFRATIANNPRLSNDIGGSVASAATITLPTNERVGITGSTTISVMNGYWDGRTVMLLPLGGVGLTRATGGGSGGFCNALTTGANVPAIATWIPGSGSSSCWAVK